MKARVAIWNTPGKTITVDSEATVGAVLGENLRWPDGTLVTIENLAPEPTEAESYPLTLWQRVLEIPVNVQALAATSTTGLYVITAAGESTTRAIAGTADQIDVAAGDGIGGNPTLSLATLANTGGGTLQRTARDAYGRLSGTSAATTDDLIEGSTNLYFTTERAQDAVGAAVTAGTGTGATLVYDDAGNKINVTNTDRGSVAVAAHEAASDPHPQYTTAVEAAAAAPVQSVVGQTGAVTAAQIKAAVTYTAANVGAEPAITAGTTAQYWRGDKSWQTLNKAAVGLGNVDNTADSAKPVSTAQAAALAGKAADASVVHLAGAEAITGAKTFTGVVAVEDTFLRFRSGGLGDGSAISLEASAKTTGNHYYRFFNLTGAYGNLMRIYAYEVGGTIRERWDVRDNGAFTFWNNSTKSLEIDPSGNATPGADNAQAFGSASYRWSQIYAGNGTINTSDAREKTPPRKLTAAEVAAGLEIALLPCIFQWIEAVAIKDRGARLHASPTVQSVIETMNAHGLDPFRYGFVCYDAWAEEPAIREWLPSRDAVFDEATGELIRPATDAQEMLVRPYRPAGDLYSLRPSELAHFVQAAIVTRLDALETRLNP